MTEYRCVKVKFSGSQLDKLKSATKNATGVNRRLAKDVVGNDKTNFLHNLFLTNRQNASIYKAFQTNFIKDIKLSKTQLS